MAHSNGLKSIFYALAANFAIAITKSVAAFITGSSAMLAEAVHSFADCGNQGLLLLGLNRAKRPPNFDYPLGYGKEIYFYSFIVAIMLFSVGGLFSIYEGFHKLSATEPMSAPVIAVAVLVFSMIAESFSLWGCIHEINKTRGKDSLLTWFKQSRESELIVVVGEDIAALGGLIFALVAVLLTWFTGNPIYDAWGSIVIGALLICVAFFIGREIKALLIGQGVDKKTLEQMKDFVKKQPQVEQVYNLLTLQMGRDVMVAIKARMNVELSANEMILAINECEKAFKQAFPQTLWLFFEPDVED